MGIEVFVLIALIETDPSITLQGFATPGEL
jgi:hypothetical protein